MARDARVLRQVEWLSGKYEVVVLGFGPEPSLPSGTRFRELRFSTSLTRRLRGAAQLLVGRLNRPSYVAWLTARPPYSDIAHILREEAPDIIVANDWVTFPVAAIVGRELGARLLFDAHEYAPLEWEHSAVWRLIYQPAVVHVLRRFLPACDAFITVAQPIARRYEREFGVSPAVILNAPRLVVLPPRRRSEENAGQVRLVHHGSAIRARGLERMIDAVGLADARYTLTFMLIGDAAYIAELQAYAARRAPGRVTFLDPVPPPEIVATIAGFDMGIFLLDTAIYNYEMALPNKLFDFLAAGLAVCIGPSPAMREVVEQHGVGCVAESFTPEACAALLNRLTAPDIERMQRAAEAARITLNADVEGAKLSAIVERLAAAPQA